MVTAGQCRHLSKVRGRVFFVPRQSLFFKWCTRTLRTRRVAPRRIGQNSGKNQGHDRPVLLAEEHLICEALGIAQAPVVCAFSCQVPLETAMG